MSESARFLELLDPDAEAFTFQAFDDSPLARGSLARIAHGSLGEEIHRLVAWSNGGAGIFVTINETDGLGRKGENIVRVRAVFVDLDGAPLAPVLSCAIEPHIITESSPERWHCYWIVAGLQLSLFAAVQKALAARFDGDPAISDLPRVMRLPGFAHQKGAPFVTRIHAVSEALPYTAEQILGEFPPVRAKANGAAEGHAADQLSDLVRGILTGDSYHAALCALAWRHISDGMDPGKVVLTLRGYMEASTAPRDDRWCARYEEIPRTVSSAQGKQQQPPADRSDQPAALDEAALYGLAGDVVRAIEPHSEADPVALLLQILAAFGNVCGRTHYMAIEGDRHPPQIWPVLVGKTAKGRKGTSWGRARLAIEAAAPDWAQDRVLSGLSSGEGVLAHVRDPLIRRFRDKKTGDYIEEEVDPGVADKRLFVVESEFAGTLRHMERTGNTLSPTLRCLWDRGDVQTLTKNTPTRTTGSMVTIVGHVTRDELRRYLTRTEMANGLANRFLYACVGRSKVLPFGGGQMDLRPLTERIEGCLGRVADRGETAVMWTDPARSIWADVYPALSEGRPGMAGAVTSRAEAQTLRLALLYALLDGMVYLEPAHLRAGLALWRYCDQSAASLFGGALGDPLADEIHRALDAAPDGMTRTNIRDLFGRHRGTAAVGCALELLLAQGLARQEVRATGGRPEERWYAQ